MMIKHENDKTISLSDFSFLNVFILLTFQKRFKNLIKDLLNMRNQKFI